MSDDAESGVEALVCTLTVTEYEILADGVALEFTFDGDVIERNPRVIVEVDPIPGSEGDRTARSPNGGGD